MFSYKIFLTITINDVRRELVMTGWESPTQFSEGNEMVLGVLNVMGKIEAVHWSLECPGRANLYVNATRWIHVDLVALDANLESIGWETCTPPLVEKDEEES